jgi:hypothetical protein
VIYSMFKPGEIIPQGWIREQLRLDLQEGLTGAYPRLSDNVSQNLFATQTRHPGTRVKGNRGLEEKAWWAGEHEGYWADAIVRSAILLQDVKWLAWSAQWVESILAKAEQTGCITIYSPETRFPDRGYDGELWTQSRAFQALLAWYEYSGDPRVLSAVEKSVHLTIDHYRPTTYFGRPDPDGGVTHGVGYMDTLEWLYRLTEDRYYADAAVWLYEDYCKAEFKDFYDLRPEELMDSSRPWNYHTPHVAEALHMPALAAAFSQRDDYRRAAANLLSKLEYHTNPGGGFVAGKVIESICQTPGGGDVTGEYCSITEGIQTLNRLMLYQPDARISRWIETAMFNAGQGARFHPANTAVVYLSRDNRRTADDPVIHGGRELYSGSHKAAACCTLNAMRILPYYIESMWLKKAEEVLLNLYGPSVLKSEIAGVPLIIDQQTAYPFSDRVTLIVSPERAIRFSLKLRIPPGSDDPQIDAGPDAEVQREGDFITVSKVWNAGDIVSADFRFQVTRRIPQDGKGSYVQWGPLVFSLPLEGRQDIHDEIASNSGGPSGFYEYFISSVSSEGWNYCADPSSQFKLIRLQDGNDQSPWMYPPVGLRGTLLDASGKPVPVTLLPLGSTQLRRTTFPSLEERAAGCAEGAAYRGSGEADDPMRFF